MNSTTPPVPTLEALSVRDRRGYRLSDRVQQHALANEVIPEQLRRDKDPALPEVSELEVVRHYTALSQRNYTVDVGLIRSAPAP